MTPGEDRFDAVILAGGKNSRMNGISKAFLEIKGKCMAEHIASCYISSGARRVILIMNSAYKNDIPTALMENTAIRIVYNGYPDKGRNKSILLGLDSCSHELPVVIHNVDNPYVSHELIRGMLSMLKNGEAVLPVQGGRRGHPVLISSSLLPALRGWMMTDRTLREFLSAVTCREYPWHHTGIHLNINTPGEYDRMNISLSK